MARETPQLRYARFALGWFPIPGRLNGDGPFFVKPYWLVIAAIALAGADRVNLVPFGPYSVVPFYLLSLPFVFRLALRIRLEFLVYLAIMAAVLFLSAAASDQAIAYSLRKSMVLLYVHAGAIAVAQYIHDRECPRVWVSGLFTFVILWLVFSALQGWSYFQGQWIDIRNLKHDGIINNDVIVSILGGLVLIRPSGGSLDANVGAFLLFISGAYLAYCRPKWEWLMKSTAFVSLIGLSRSALLGVSVSLWHKHRRFLVLVWCVFALYVSLLPNGVLSERFGFFRDVPVNIEDSRASSNVMRLFLLKLWVDSMGHSGITQWIFGHGAASSSKAVSQVLGTEWGDFANQYANIVYEFGIVGIAFYACVAWLIFRRLGSTARWRIFLPWLVFQVFYPALGEELILMMIASLYLQRTAGEARAFSFSTWLRTLRLPAAFVSKPRSGAPQRGPGLEPEASPAASQASSAGVGRAMPGVRHTEGGG